MNLKRAPVLITVYDRYDHLRQTIEALSRNVLADETIVYIASDAPQDEASAPKIKKVRDYIATIRGFKAVVPLLRDENVGGFENSQMGWQEVWSEHDRAIRMEDDIVTGRGFLKFMNDGLDKFKAYDDVFGVCGYLHPVKEVIRQEYLFIKKMNAWGVGTWREKFAWLNNMRGTKVPNEYLRSWRLFHELNQHSPHVIGALPRLASGEMRAGDYEYGLILRKTGGLCVYPNKSLVRNIGFDGTGMHCGVDSNIGEQPLYDGEISLHVDYPVRESVHISRACGNAVVGRRARRIRFQNLLVFLFFKLVPHPQRCWRVYRDWRMNSAFIRRLRGTRSLKTK